LAAVSLDVTVKMTLLVMEQLGNVLANVQLVGWDIHVSTVSL